MSTVLVTGATGGIGLEFCRRFSARGEKVFAVCRNDTDELKALPVEIISDVDLTKEDAYERISNAVGQNPIDIVVNNAGLLESNSIDHLDIDSLRRQFEINAIAPIRLSQKLLPNLRDGGKIAMISSRMGSITDNTSGGSYGYRASKAALNIMGVSLARDLQKRNIWVGLLHPGYVKTKMTGMTGHIDPKTSVEGLINLIDNSRIDQSGLFWHTNGEQLPW